MLSWLKGLVSSTPHSAPTASTPAALRAKVLEENIPRYPPFMKGLPALPPEKLVESQFELLQQIQSSVIVTKALYEKHYLGAIRRFAAFAHLLPASQSHHHRGAGGLLAHSMECGLMALQGSDKMLLDLGRPPSHRRELEPRLQLAAFLGGLCHDAGKPATDITVYSHDRETTWRPIAESLWDWSQANGIDAYFLEWRAGRNKSHQSLSALLSERVITKDTLAWIAEGGTELVVWLMESLSENPTATNPLYELVKRADQASVKRDLETMGTAMAGYEVGVPVERSITDKMRNLVRQGLWMVNEPGARVWNIEGHIYLVWPAAGQELAQAIREEGVPGIPRTADSILDMLVERQLAFLPEGHDTPDRLWRIAPECITAKIPGKELTCIRLRHDSLISTTPIGKVPGVVVGLAGTATAAEVAPQETVQNSGKPLEQKDQAPDAAAEPASQKTGKTQRSKPIAIAPQTVDGPAAAASAVPSSGGPSFAHDPDTGEVLDPRFGGGTGASAETPASAEQAAPVPPAAKPKAKRTDKPTIKFDGAAGEGLKALMDDLRSGTRQWGVDVRVDEDEQILVTWPTAFSGYGLTGKVLLEEMSVNEWLWIDDDNPLRKLQDLDVGNGETIKVLRLSYEASYAFLYEVKPTEGKNGAPARQVEKVAAQEAAVAPPSAGAAQPVPSSVAAPAPPVLAATVPSEAAPPRSSPPRERTREAGKQVEPQSRGEATAQSPREPRKDKPKKERPPNRSMPSLIPHPPASLEAVAPAPQPETVLSDAQQKLAEAVEKRLSSNAPPGRKPAPRKDGVSIDQVLAAFDGGGGDRADKPGWKELLLQDGRKRLKDAGVEVERSALFGMCKEHPDHLEMAKGLILFKPKK
ncbi:MobH family relaxase [Acidovorax sp. sic0104]|uniref:MobH family relaxase n=1 Tax=Acidovorax sp. sic0104 TaxID=2854784 RepID=UPI001C47CF4B|nr:MobH family relaxase [Acidovorax sp. sic0104]MBV7542131.1 TraI domain-containing protein [Acidovorax sp. sic0104]